MSQRAWRSSMRVGLRRWVVLLSLGPLAATHAAGAQFPADSFAIAAARLAAARAPALPRGERDFERRAIVALYPPLTARPLWSDRGSPTAQAREAIVVLTRARDRGLVADDYRADEMRALEQALDESGAATPAAEPLARFDVSLSRALVHLLSDLHFGRVTAASVGFELPARRPDFDLAALVRRASTASSVDSLVTLAEPSFVGYMLLERRLDEYRALSMDTTLRTPLFPRRTLRPGAAYDDAPALRRFLAALGDLASADAQDTSRRYDEVLARGVVAFQERHALDADGVVGPATMAQLRVPLAARVRQIELTLERWRWLPSSLPPRLVIVNVPGFRLYAFDDAAGAQQMVFATNVIVGKAEGRHWTPVFTTTMRGVMFRPPWEVPPRIARTELVPLIRRDPGYAEREGFDIVDPGNERVRSMTAANLAAVARGALRLRQRPGPRNALGLVKFVMPNAYNVYLHDTPARQLFAETRRDFSHGCVRVEHASTLAEVVLRGQGDWDPAAIERAMWDTATFTVDLTRPVSVYVLYATAVARPDGTIRFYADLYGRDAALERALGLPRAGQRELATRAAPAARVPVVRTLDSASSSGILVPRGSVFADRRATECALP